MKRILITGGHGFIGSAVTPYLAKKFNVISPTRAQLDLMKPIGTKVVEGLHAIVHLAGEVKINKALTDPSSNIEHNIRPLINMLEAVRQLDQKPLIVFASTDRLYGKTKRRTVTETEAPFPLEPYTAAKIMCEELLMLYAHLYGVPYIILRLDSVYGPHQPREMFISDIIQKMKDTTVVETGALSVRKNFVYTGDVAHAILCALRAPKSAYSQVYNIGGTSASLKDVATICTSIVASKLNKHIELRPRKGLSRSKKAEVVSFNLSTQKAARMLKWRPRVTLHQGLEHTIDYFLHQ